MSRKILIVDDEFCITRSLSFMFKKEGYVCETVHDGQGALDRIAAGKPALIFLDVDMPVKDGYEAAREIRANPKWRDVHIIMLTAKGQDLDREKGFQAGADEYILKPFDPRAVLKRVKEIIG